MPSKKFKSYATGGKVSSSPSTKTSTPTKTTGGSSTVSKGMNYSAADYKAAGYGSYQQAPNTTVRTPTVTPTSKNTSVVSKGTNYSAGDYQSAGYRDYRQAPSAPAPKPQTYGNQNMTKTPYVSQPTANKNTSTYTKGINLSSADVIQPINHVSGGWKEIGRAHV